MEPEVTAPLEAQAGSLSLVQLRARLPRRFFRPVVRSAAGRETDRQVGGRAFGN
jgi:hypothetical protein